MPQLLPSPTLATEIDGWVYAQMTETLELWRPPLIDSDPGTEGGDVEPGGWGGGDAEDPDVPPPPTLVATVQGMVHEETGHERIVSGQREAEQVISIKIKYRPDLTEEDFFVWRGHVLDIDFIADVQATESLLDIVAIKS